MHHFDSHYFARQDAIDRALLAHFADAIGPGKLVVDVGPGYDPWPYATEYVDFEAWPQLAGKRVHAIDVECDRLPYEDKSVDFLYCRQALEDMGGPTLLLREMNRVAKAGYIETPSPLVELCTGAGGGDCRGHSHHRGIVWVSDGILKWLPKLPLVEGMSFTGSIEQEIGRLLSSAPQTWFTCHPWRDQLKFAVLQNGRDFDLRKDYTTLLTEAIHSALISSNWFVQTFGLLGAQFLGTPGAELRSRAN